MQAFAKINLFLDVADKRNDGYHNIISIMQTVSLCDELLFRKIGKGGEIIFSCNAPHIPKGEENLVIKAAKILFEKFDINDSIEINLTKRIPLGAGLAGGSADCAATLLGLTELLDLDIPIEVLLEIGKTLGADVPFCLTGGTALCEGIGEKITPLAPLDSGFFVIACPKIHISTKEIFEKITLSGRVNARKLQELTQAGYKKNFFNIFTKVTGKLHPEIYSLIEAFKNQGAFDAEMSGTGSSVYAYFDDEQTALNALNALETNATKVFLCKPICEQRL